jgi:hypothetical protein
MYGSFGWNTGFESIMPRGHEILTERALGMSRPGAAGSVTFTLAGKPVVTELGAQETSDIVEGNRAVDVADLTVTQRMIQAARARPYLLATPFGPALAAGMAALTTSQLANHVVHSVSEADQKLHALRRNPGQDWRTALREIVAELVAQHRDILADGNPRSRLRRIGAALHMIQDSYCPAHTSRTDAGCIDYVRNYGGNDTPLWERGGAAREHMFPMDARDSVAAHPAQASLATQASREYLQIVFKAIYGRMRADPAAVAEADGEFQQFVQRHFRPC